MNKNYVIMLLAGWLLIPNAFLVAQDQPSIGNSRFVMTLQDEYVQRLKSSGSLQSPVLADAQGKISAVQIQFSGSATQAAVAAPAVATVNGNICQIKLDDSTIDMARTQPIRVEVPAGSMFTKVFLIYDLAAAPAIDSLDPTTAGSSTSSTAPAASATGFDDISYFQHFVKLSDESAIVGQMELDQELAFETKFGEVKISMGQIAGIRFHIDGEDAAMVVLKNGDSITGTPVSESFEMNTDWGRAEFDPVFVEAITTSANAQFRQTNDPGFGPRWQLNGR